MQGLLAKLALIRQRESIVALREKNLKKHFCSLKEGISTTKFDVHTRANI